jgi:hypothetical protein
MLALGDHRLLVAIIGGIGGGRSYFAGTYFLDLFAVDRLARGDVFAVDRAAAGGYLFAVDRPAATNASGPGGPHKQPQDNA